MLILGFEGYGGRGINPSQEITKALDGRNIAGTRTIGRVLPVRYDTLRTSVSSLIAEIRPRAVIAIGLWPGEPLIRVERVAVNLNDFEIPDNEGALEKGPIQDGGPAGRLSTLPVGAICDAILAAGIPARPSSTAGNFLCNAMMYTALAAAEPLDPPPPTGFIHVPYMPSQVAEMIANVRDEHALEQHQRADFGSMALETMIQALEISVETTLAAAP